MTGTIKDLFGKYESHPILVIGGGPSVRHDLPRLVDLGVKPACVISANSHGMLQTTFTVDYIVHVDKRHAGLKVWMKDHLQPFGIPLISSHSYADYRLPELHFNRSTGLNSGLMALYVAMTLGGSPVISTGIDLWATGRNYFHDAGTDRKNRMPRPSSGTAAPSAFAIERYRAICQESNGARVRPVSGPFTTLEPQFDLAEPWQWWRRTKYRERLEATTCRTYRATAGFQFSSGDRVGAGQLVALSVGEAEKYPVAALDSLDII